MSALLEQPAPAVADDLETQEAAVRELTDRLTALGAEIDDKRDQYNALWQRLQDVQAGVTKLRRARARGVEFAGGMLYHIEEAGAEE